jgi:hypothetical protein
MSNAGTMPPPARPRPPLTLGHAATLRLFDFALFWLLIIIAALLTVRFPEGALHTLGLLVFLAAIIEAIWSLAALIIGLTRSPAAASLTPADPRYAQSGAADADGERVLKPGGIGAWFMILLCAGLAWFGVELCFAPPTPKANSAIAGLIIAIPCGFAAIRCFFARPTIRLDSEGMTLSQFGRSARYRWRDITHLTLSRGGRAGAYPCVFFKASTRLFGQVLIANYGMSPDALFGLLNQYRQAALQDRPN